MTALELMQSIGQVSDAYIAEARDWNRFHTKPHRIKKSLLIAAILTMALLLVGCSIMLILQYAPMLETLFGANGRGQYESDWVSGMPEPGGKRTTLDDALAQKFIDPYVFPVTGTLSDGERRLTALSCLTDRTSCTASVYMKLENPPAYDVYNSGWLLFRGENPWYIHPWAIGQDNVIGRCFIDEASTTSTELYFVFLFSCEPSCTELALSIGELPEKITIPLPKQTNLPSLILENGGIQISPLGMEVSASLLSLDDSPVQPARNPRELAIQFQDGSEYLICSKGLDGQEDYVGYTYGMALNFSLESYVFVFNRVVDVGDIAAFRINGHVYKA